MRKVLLAAMTAAVLVVLFASAQGTAALWRAENHVPLGTITTGSLALEVGQGNATAQEYSFAQLNTGTLAPGGFVQAPLTIRNNGTAALNYILAGAHSATTAPVDADTKLAAAVVLSVHAAMTPAACTAGASGGTLLYSGPLAGATFPHARELTVNGGSETLCVRVALPGNAPQAASGGRLQLVLSWRGDQL